MTNNANENFNHERANKGVDAACDAFDALGLTLPERYWAARCVGIAAAELLGEKISSLLDKDLAGDAS